MKTERQAVIIIHGIGEQKPMGTLRGFVSTLTGQFGEGEATKNRKFYSKPDMISNSLELRRLTTPKTAENIKTDYFEYYWAYRIRDTKLEQVLQWIAGLLFRLPWSLPKRIRFVHLFIWFLIIAVTCLIWYNGGLNFKREDLPLWIGTLSTIAISIVTYIFTSYLGDVVRYTSPAPGNISKRQKIRRDGLRLLRTIHDSKKYSRIVLVGHSLGSIIAYDLIRYFWSECNEKYQGSDVKVLKEFEKKYANHEKDFNLGEYTKWQSTILNEQQNDGNPWLISDLVTLGSPLTYSSFLLARDKVELDQRIAERELPSSPPFYETLDGRKSITFKPEFPVGRETLHHASPFACTKWTNIYYKNDFVGGSLKDCFGPGIAEHTIDITSAPVTKRIPFLSHTHYWGDSEKDCELCTESVQHLKGIIFKAPVAEFTGQALTPPFS